MIRNGAPAAQGCIFCAIAARQAEASVVYEDETAVVFMDANRDAHAIKDAIASAD